jgi:phage tail sheath gpL-like
MKVLSVILLCAAAGSAADFTNGQAARLVIGQSTFTSQDANSSDTIIGAASGLAYAGDTLFVADSNRVGASPSNHRVLLFQNLSGMLPTPTAQIDYTRKCPVCLGQATVVLGQPDFTTTTENVTATPSTLRLPTAVASDGVHLVVADTNHNRVLIWNRIPTSNDQPADVVVGQQDFKSALTPGNLPNAKAMRGPQGVWIQNGKLYVCDTQYNRVLIWNSIPTTNGAAADVVLGQANMTTFVQPDLTQQKNDVTAKALLNPVSVSSDGTRLFVTDLGYNRVLIWNTIPTSNGQPADVAVGQPDLVSSIANYGYKTDPNDTTNKQTPVLCTESNGTDSNSNPTYPSVCKATLSFPRFALAAGNRLFIADGGNDRVLVFNNIPTQSGATADYVLGQIGGSVNQASDAADSLRTPQSLAWDGTNLYVSDSYNRRITVYSIGEVAVPYTGVRNAASLDIVARGTLTVSGNIQEGDVIKVNIGGTTTTDSSGTSTTTGGNDYSYTVKKDDTIANIIQQIASLINAANSGTGDPNVYATPDVATSQVLLTSRVPGTDGNSVTYSVKLTAASSATTVQISVTAGGSTLSGGGDAAKVAPGSLAAIQASDGSQVAFQTASADPNNGSLPTTLGDTQVYFNGIRAPLMMVSPSKVVAQIPWEVADTTSINAYVRSARADGSVQVTSAVAATIVPANPGIFAIPDTQPSVGVVYHASSTATGIISVDGSVHAGDVATITIEDRTYNYTVQSGDSLDNIRDALVSLINSGDPKVIAKASGVFDRILLQARVQGPEGNNIPYSASASSGASVIMTPIGNQLCCANVADTLVTADNPAVPGEMIYVLATGVGLPVLTDTNQPFITTGLPYPDSAPPTAPSVAMNAIAGGKTADVISATLLPNSVGTYKVLLHLNPDLPTDPYSQLTIAQDVYVSNIVTLPIVNVSGQ